MMMMMIPPGYHFAPKEEELISGYLLRRSLGLPLPSDQVLEKDLYGENANPWDIFNNVGDDSHWTTLNAEGSKKVKKVVYVFTKLSKVNGKTRVARTAGCGKWDGQTGGKEIYNASNEEIGVMKTFSFQAKKSVSTSSGNDDDNWIMHEYSLSGTSLKYDHVNKDLVICKITRVLSKEKFDREEEEKQSTVDYDDQNIIKKRSFGEIVQVEDQYYPTNHKKQKSTAVVATQEFDETVLATPEMINDGNFACTLAPDFDFENWTIDDDFSDLVFNLEFNC